MASFIAADYIFLGLIFNIFNLFGNKTYWNNANLMARIVKPAPKTQLWMPSFGLSRRTLLAAVGQIQLENRLLVRALISAFSADDDNNNHSQECWWMGRRERRRLFKEACVQLLSAIKTQISEDELELKKKRARAHEPHPIQVVPSRS